MYLTSLFKRNFLFIITIIFIMISSLTAKASSFTPETYSYAPTNYTNVILNIVNQYTNPASDSASEGSAGLKKAKYKFLSINPFRTFPPSRKGCFFNSWSVSEVSASTAFLPQISVTNKFMAFCVGYEATLVLHGYGQCGFISLFRVCSRVTLPCEHGNNFCCNNSSCAASDSCPNCALQQDTRICAFGDPMFPADATDTKPGGMPFHEETVVPSNIPSGDSLIILGAFIFTAGLLVPGLGQGAMLIGAGLMLAGGIMELLQFITSKINYVVTSNHGCVDIPLAPSPPPYCSQIPGYIPQASVMSLCQQSPDFSNNILANNYQNYTYASSITTSPSYPSNTQISTQDMNCEISSYNNASLYSTFENPAVRISFDNPIPACKDGYSGKFDTCIFTRSLNDPLSIWYNSKNLLPVCTGSITSNCIVFPSGITPNAKFRPLYNMTNTSSLGIDGASGTNVNFSVLSTYPNWLSSISSSLIFSGINYSNFIDASPGNLVSITDYTGIRRKFVVYLNDKGDKVCVAERVGNSTEAVYISTPPSADIPLAPNCVDRPAISQKPIITACNSTGTNNCSYPNSFSTASCYTSATCPFSGTKNLATSPRIMFSIGQTTPKTGVIEVDTAIPYTGSYSPTYQNPTASCVVDDVSASNSSSGKITYSGRNCSLYGYNVFTAYVTDIYNQTQKNLNSSNQNISPSYATVNLNNAGAQFANGFYCRGATQICLDGYSDPTKIVVAKVIANNLYSSSGSTSGTMATYNASNITSDRVIPPYNSSNPNEILTRFFDPTTQYQKTSQSQSRVAIGTYDSTNKLYIENSYCTADVNNYCQANGTPSLDAPVSTTCICRGTSGNCTINGCDQAFVTYQTNNPIEIGQYVNGSYSKNSYCTQSSDYSCQAPCIATGNCPSPFNPTNASCKCYQNCDNNCKPGTLTSSGYCTISGCEYAFQPSYSSSFTSSSYFVSSSGKSYPISGSASCPNQYSTSSGGSCYQTREANPIELGLCSPIPQPSCPQINYENASDSGAAKDGYANWPNIVLGSANLNVTGTCITGTTQSRSGPPTRSCTYVDNGFEQIANSSGNGTLDGCPKYTVAYGTVTNPCLTMPLWWPSQFLVNKDFKGAIFNHFNINYDYVNVIKPYSNNYSQYGKAKEDWVLDSNPNSCQYNYTYHMGVYRKDADGDQEMLFIRAEYWNKFLNDRYDDLKWLFATEKNIPSGASYSNYNGCYVYYINDYISVSTTRDIKIGMKICKFNDYISFSLVDLSANPNKSYRNNAYIMQSNILDYLGNTAVNNYALNNQAGGRFINHGIVIYRPGFELSNSSSTSFDSAPPPSDFIPIQTPESIDLTYNYYNESQSIQSGERSTLLCNFTKYLTRSGTPGCALAMHRASISYPYPYGNTVAPTCSAGTCNFFNPTGYYVPIANNSKNTGKTYSLNNTDNYGNYYYYTGNKYWSNLQGYKCAAKIMIDNYVYGNSANNPSMFYWTSPNNYSPCHPNYTNPSELTQQFVVPNMNLDNCLKNYPK